MIRAALLAILFVASASAQPRSVWLPEAMQKTASLEESRARAPEAFLTEFEKSSYRRTGNYEESLRLLRAMEKQSRYARLLTLGNSPQGRPLVVLIASKDRAFTPEAAARTGKPVIFVQNGIHSGEIAGKDASLMLLRDVLISKKYEAWLDRVILAVMPVFNVDGHERTSPYHRINQNGPEQTGFRATSQRINLNRDYIKADAPEMHLWLTFFNAWLPDFFIDNHVTDGADFQYDVTYCTPTEQDVWPTVGRWAKQVYLPYMEQTMTKDGHVIAPYGSIRAPGTPFIADTFAPRFSHAYAAAQNRASLLVETHSLKPHRTQAWAHFDIMKATIEAIVAAPERLKNAVKQADGEVAALAGLADMPLAFTPDPTRGGVPFVFRSVASRMESNSLSGAPYPVYLPEARNIETRLVREIKTTFAPMVPQAYVIPREYAHLGALLSLHGIQTRTVAGDQEVEGEEIRFSEARWGDRPFEGRNLVDFKTKVVPVKARVRAGALVVPMNHRAARVAMYLLEPGSPDSLVRWGFFNTLFEQKEYFSPYVFEPLAAKMLAENPTLKAEFEAKIKNEPEFAKSPRDRLFWLYERSPWYESDKDRYPVLRAMKPLP
jgi:hypothetical protein